MVQENRRYVFINTSDLGSIDFSCFYQNANTVRKNLAGTECALSYDGNIATPTCLSGITILTKDWRTEHTTAQASDIINNLENSLWNDNTPA